jgi:predicted alpha/beta superfamily hydrolase
VHPQAILLLHDGQNVFADRRSRRPSWRAEEVATRLIASARIVPLAIVGIDHGGPVRRWSEYLPYGDPRNPRARRFEADRYADELVGAILPALPHLQPELSRVRVIGLGGSSYGAIGALHVALRHPGVFDRLLLESAPLWVGQGRLIEGARRATRLPRRVWIGVGTAESRREERSAELVARARRLAAAMRARSKVRLRVARGAPHHERAWAARLPEALRWLFPPGAPASRRSRPSRASRARR